MCGAYGWRSARISSAMSDMTSFPTILRSFSILYASIAKSANSSRIKDIRSPHDTENVFASSPPVIFSIVSVSLERIHFSYGRRDFLFFCIVSTSSSLDISIFPTFIHANLIIFQNLLRKREFSSIVFMLKLRFVPGVFPITRESLSASVENSLMTSSGSMTFHQLLLIFFPFSSRTSPWR